MMMCSCGSGRIRECDVNTWYKDESTLVRETYCQCTCCGRAFYRYEYFKKIDQEFVEAKT